MADDGRLQELLLASIEIQKAMLKLLAYPHVASEATMTKKAIKLRRDFGLAEDVLADITGVRPDNLRTALEREGLR